MKLSIGLKSDRAGIFGKISVLDKILLKRSETTQNRIFELLKKTKSFVLSENGLK